MAFCAVCQCPIVTPQPFVLEGCEALHRECARLPHTTLGRHRAEREAAAVARAANAERMLAQHRATEARDARERESLARTHRLVVKDFHDEIREQRNEIASVTAALEAARRESALHQMLAATPSRTAPIAPAPVVAQPPPAPPAQPDTASTLATEANDHDDRSDFAVRCAMLELY